MASLKTICLKCLRDYVYVVGNESDEMCPGCLKTAADSAQHYKEEWHAAKDHLQDVMAECNAADDQIANLENRLADQDSKVAVQTLEIERLTELLGIEKGE